MVSEDKFVKERNNSLMSDPFITKKTNVKKFEQFENKVANKLGSLRGGTFLLLPNLSNSIKVFILQFKIQIMLNINLVLLFLMICQNLNKNQWTYLSQGTS